MGGNGKDNETWSILHNYSFLKGGWSAPVLYSYLLVATGRVIPF